MPIVKTDDKVEDFYTKLVGLIDDGREDEALELFIRHGNKRRIEFLKHLGKKISDELVIARSFAIACVNARARTNTLSIDFHNAYSKSRYSSKNKRGHSRVLARSRALADDIVQISDLADDIDIDALMNRVEFIIEALEVDMH